MDKALRVHTFYVLTLLVSMILLLLDQLGYLQWYKNIYSFITYPVVSFTQTIHTSTQNGILSILYSTSLKEENGKLQAKILDIESTLAEQQKILDTDATIKDTLKALAQQPYKKIVNAVILDSSVGNITGIIELNKGLTDGIKQGMPVVVKGNYLGYIDSVSSYTAIAKTLDVPGQSLAGYILARKLQGTIQTDISQVSLHDILATETVQTRDSVATTRNGYPYFFPVGIITSAPSNNGSAERVGIITPYVSTNDTSIVTVIIE